MLVIELTYKAPLTEIDADMAAHVRFLKKYCRPAISWPRVESAPTTFRSESRPTNQASDALACSSSGTSVIAIG